MSQVTSPNNSTCNCSETSQGLSESNMRVISPCCARVQRIWHSVCAEICRPFIFAFSALSGCIDSARFFVRFLKNPKGVGALLPSSKALARQIISEIPKETERKIRILEVGPGMGAFTKEIVKKMGENATLDLVEFDGNFVKRLQKKYKMTSNVKVYQQCILEHKEWEKYDYIVSGLPLNSFSVEMVRNVFEKFRKLSTGGTKIAYFEYPVCSMIANIFSKRARQIVREKDGFFKQHGTSKRTVLRNFPPAQVRYHEVRSSSACT